MKFNPFVLLVALVLFTQCNDSTPSKVIKPKKKNTPSIPYTVVDHIPHDINAFTEGFFIHNGQLFESTGSPEYLPNSESVFGIVDTATGTLIPSVTLNRKHYFGEGITLLNGKIYQLTYLSQTGFIYDAESYKQIGTFTIPSKEGWGMTTDGKHLIMSDGTFKLSYLDPETMTVISQLSVAENGYAKKNLNELEYINGFIYANVWMTNNIVKIDPETGKVVGKMNLDKVAQNNKSFYPNSMEMNGIAFDEVNNLVYVTGKLWGRTYRLKLDHQ
jgi:glutamine cyclotransferase